MTAVVILQHRLVHYRATLFDELRSACSQRGIELQLVYGQASRRETKKKDEGSLPWAHKVKNRFIEIGSRDLLWQPIPRSLRDAKLFILMQENRILSNYPFLLRRIWSPLRIAYWGHGANFQSDFPNGLRERWKKTLLTRVDWWFAYTETTAQVVRQAGYPPERITCLNNAIDNTAFERDLSSVPAASVQALRDEIHAIPGAPVGLFCGSLYPDKRLEYMIAAADLIHSELPTFRLVVIGDGPSGDIVSAASETRPWLRWVGALRGIEKAAWFRVADVVVNPGLVGLHVLDAFSAGLPIVTAADSRHSPEISYLKSGINGLIVTGDVKNYANEIIGLFGSRQKLADIKRAALQEAKHITLGNMVTRFVDGIAECLATPKIGRGP